ncbi:membrane protein [Geomonas silvestris]|uniref:Membrane protein n=1 Tax=Geomonas silvestris TaxID=2740184 RepID=A0A6V8MD75_9BACT|nr:glycosyltransferase family 39 protein [Geomonas silvestris]GFO57951.1 membrane protein [Geomonas silvestris]
MLKTKYQILFLAFIVLGLYYPALFSPSCSTDDSYMINNLLNMEDFSIRALFFPHGAGQYYRPLLYLSFVFDKYLWGLEESFMHLENVLLHLVNTLLVFAVTRQLLKLMRQEADNWLPLAAALIFAVHPINTEPVNWISGRTDLMAGTFVLTSLWLLLESLRSAKVLPAFLSGCALLLGCLCKEPALFFAPPALFLVLCYDRMEGLHQSIRARIVRGAAPVLFIVLGASAYLLMRSSALSSKDSGIAAVTKQIQAPPTDILNLARIVAKLTGFYLKKVFLPFPLNFGIVEVANLYVVPGVLFLLVLCWLLYRRSVSAFLVFSGFCICAPSFILAVSEMSWTPIAERYLYMPSACFAIWLVFQGSRLLKDRLTWAPVMVSALGLLLTGSAYATVSRGILWQDNAALFADTLKKSPNFGVARNDLGVALLKQGKKEEAYKIFKSGGVGNFQAASLNIAKVLIEEKDFGAAHKLLRERYKEHTRYHAKVLDMLVQVLEAQKANAKTPHESRVLNRELAEVICEQYQATGNPFYQYRLGLTHLSLDNRSSAYRCFSSAKAAAPATAHYRPAAIRLAQQFRKQAP